MDILVMVFLSFSIAGKFRKAEKQGAAKYILGMIGAILGAEFVGLGLTYTTGSPLGLGGAMVVGVAAAVLIYRAAGKAVLADNGGVSPAAHVVTDARALRRGAAITAAGSLLSMFGYLLSMVLNTRLNLYQTWLRGPILALRIRMPGQLFGLLCFGATVLVCAGFLFLGACHRENTGLLKASRIAAVSAGLYGIYLLVFAVSYRWMMYTGGMEFLQYRRAMIRLVPCLIMVFFLLATGWFVLKLYPYLNRPAKGFAMAATVVFALVVVYILWALALAFIHSNRAYEMLYTWFGAPVLGYLLLAVAMVCTALSKKDRASAGMAS